MQNPGTQVGRVESVRIAAYHKLIHDLRSGLSPILMQAQLLLHYAQTPTVDAETVKKSAGAIEQSAKEMAVLLEDL